VHAVDTFVSSDSPLEIKTFADVPLGSGAVARALDNSSVTPGAGGFAGAGGGATESALQVGSTNGGNDGSVFASWGVPDVPLSWPLRYAHSPAEVIDLKDVQALAQLIQAVAEDW
jgi:putative aminopeptidase FrvX